MKPKIKKPSMTVVIPALNEEGNLEQAVGDVLLAIDDRFDSYELILINDGSTDRTGEIADKLASKNPAIRVVHHRTNKGLGYSVLFGYREAAKEFVMWYPGDNAMLQNSLIEMMKHVGEADIVIPYVGDTTFRSRRRRFISDGYVRLLNFMFGLKIRYFNGVNVYRTCLVKNIRSTTAGFAFFAETLIRLLSQGCTYIEIPTYHRVRTAGSTKAFRFLNIFEVLKVLAWLFYDIRIRRRITNDEGR